MLPDALLRWDQTLQDVLKKRRRISESEGKYYGWQILDGLAYIHQQGVLHRDIKPANLFLDANMHVKIADFGLAERLRPDGNSARRTFCGTPSFIAPEVIRKRGGHTDSSDVWAVGITLYMLLVGRPPFEGSSTDATYRRILRATTLVWPSGTHLAVSDAAKDLVQLMLQHEPAQRITVPRCKGHVFFHGRPESLPASAQFSCPPGLKDRPGTAGGTAGQGGRGGGSNWHHEREPMHPLVPAPAQVAAPRVGSGSGSGSGSGTGGGSSNGSSGDSGGGRDSSERGSQEERATGNQDSAGSGGSGSGPRAVVRPWATASSGGTSSGGDSAGGSGGLGMGSGAPMPLSAVRAGGRPPRWQLRHGGNRLIPPPPTASSAAAAAAANNNNLLGGGLAVRCGVRSSGLARQQQQQQAQQPQRPATSHGEEGRRRHATADDDVGRGGGGGGGGQMARTLGGLSERLVIEQPGNNSGGGVPKYTMVRSADAAMPVSSAQLAEPSGLGGSSGPLDRRRQQQQQQQQQQQRLPLRQSTNGGGAGGPMMQAERPRRPSTAGPKVETASEKVARTVSSGAQSTAAGGARHAHGPHGQHAQPLSGSPTALLGHAGLVRGGGGAGGNRTLGATTGALRERLQQGRGGGQSSSRPRGVAVLTGGHAGPGSRAGMAVTVGALGGATSGGWLMPSQSSLLAASSG